MLEINLSFVGNSTEFKNSKWSQISNVFRTSADAEIS